MHIFASELGSLGQKSVDFDDLAVSDSGLNGLLNDHMVKPDSHPPIKPVDKITNQIGKPLIPLPQQNLKRQSQSSYGKFSETRSTQRATTTTTLRPRIRQSQELRSLQQLGGRISGGDGDTPRKECDWMRLQDFKNVSLETGELIVRDDEEQPCYLLSVRGFIKLNENGYFPLSNFQFHHPRLHRFILTGSPSDGASVRTPYLLNCSVLTSDGSVPSSNMRYSPLLRLTFPFKEEIIIRVKCGYLVLQIHGDGFHLTLNSLSFYQDPTVRRTQERDRNSKNSREILPQMESEHLVFSSEPVSAASPLLMIPLTSRFTCQNRVVLSGNNSVQLVLDKFELQRLAFSPSRNSDPQANTSIGHSDLVLGKQRSIRQTMDEKNSSHSKRSKRHTTRDAQVKVNFPSGKSFLLFLLRKSSLDASFCRWRRDNSWGAIKCWQNSICLYCCY